MKHIELANLDACVEDMYRAAGEGPAGPEEPTKYVELLSDLKAARPKLPRLYRSTVVRPFLAEFEDLGAAEFQEILNKDLDRTCDAGLLLDIAQAILGNAGGHDQGQVKAFQAVLADLYDGFLSAEDRAGVQPPEHGVVAPLVRPGSPESGPYTWPADQTESWSLRAGIVSVPAAYAHGGLLGWAVLGHEAAGHDILAADDGLLAELAARVREALGAARLPEFLVEYWSERVEETASDVCGLLNMGPAAGVGMITFLRGFRASGTMRTVGPNNDEHPADVLRGWLAAEVVRGLSFRAREAWAEVLRAETDADVTRPVRLGGNEVETKLATRSATVVARTLARTPLETLEGRSLGSIQDWRDRDERIVARLRKSLKNQTEARRYRAKKTDYATHMVAAAVYEAARTAGADVSAIFGRMLILLGQLDHPALAWGPGFAAWQAGPRRRSC